MTAAALDGPGSGLGRRAKPLREIALSDPSVTPSDAASKAAASRGQPKRERPPKSADSGLCGVPVLS